METQQQRNFVFGMIFDMANKLQVLGDRFLKKDGMTTKQWFLTLVVDQYGDSFPTLGEVAGQLGTSRQNAKQIALKLEANGFLKIEKDASDSRTLRLSNTDKARRFWSARQDLDNAFISELFKGMTDEEIRAVYSGIQKLGKNIQKMSESNRW